MQCRATHRCSIYRSRFFTELESDMSTTRYEHKDLRGIGVIGALAAALLASACGDESSDPTTQHSGGSVLNAGSAYAATVQGTPDGLTCSVANDVGTADIANVNDGVATCSEKLYTLGGTISGLTRAGLVLANGADIVPVAANTTSLSLPTPVAYTHGYAVTVASQPEGLICSVSNGSGLMPASNITNIKVKCLDNADSVGASARDLNPTGLVLFLALARSARCSRL